VAVPGFLGAVVDCRVMVGDRRGCKELGWQAKVPFDKGIEETILWYRANEKWWRPLLKRLIKEDSWKK